MDSVGESALKLIDDKTCTCANIAKPTSVADVDTLLADNPCDCDRVGDVGEATPLSTWVGDSVCDCVIDELPTVGAEDNIDIADSELF